MEKEATGKHLRTRSSSSTEEKLKRAQILDRAVEKRIELNRHIDYLKPPIQVDVLIVGNETERATQAASLMCDLSGKHVIVCKEYEDHFRAQTIFVDVSHHGSKGTNSLKRNAGNIRRRGGDIWLFETSNGGADIRGTSVRIGGFIFRRGI